MRKFMKRESRELVPKELRVDRSDAVLTAGKRYLRSVHKACTRCGDHRVLEVNHIIAVADGGTNELSNLDLLCKRCHLEWHLIIEEATNYPYELWHAAPSYLEFLLFWIELDNATIAVDGECEPMALDEVLKSVRQARKAWFRILQAEETS